MPAMRTDLGFGGLMTPAGYYDEMIMGGGGGEAVPAEAAPPAALPAPGVAGGYSSYVPPEQAAPPPTEMPPAGIAGGYGSTDPYAGQPQPLMDQAVGPTQDPYGAYGAAQPLPFDPNAAPLSPPNPAPYTGPNYLSEPAGDLATMPGSVAYGGTNLSTLERRLGGRSVQPAGDPYVTTLPRTGDAMTPVPFGQTQVPPPAEADWMNPPLGWGTSPTGSGIPLSRVEAGRGSFNPTLSPTMQAPPVQGTPLYSTGDRQNSLSDLKDPYAAYSTQRSDIMTLPASQPPAQTGSATVVPYADSAPINPDAAGLNTPLGGSFENPYGGAADMTQRERDALGVGLVSIPDATTLNYEVGRRNQAKSVMDRQRQERASAPVDPEIAAALTQSDAGIADQEQGGTSAGAEARRIAAWNQFDPFNRTRKPGDSVGVADPYATPTTPTSSTQQTVGGTSAGAATPVVNDGDVSRNRASKLLTPDLQFVNSERTSDAWGAGTGSNQVRVITGEGAERYGTDALVTPESLQAAEGAGMAGWNLNDAEFQALVDAGLVVPEAKADVVGKTLLIPKDWVDALGGVPAAGDSEALTNVQDVVATDPYAGGSGDGGGSTWNGSGGGGGWKNYGRGGGGGAWGSGGGWSDWGSSGGDLSAAPAWETSDEGSPFDNPIFARYFDVLSRHFGADRANAMMRGGFGRSLGRKGRSRRVGGKRMTTKGRTSVSVPGGASVEFGGDSIRKSVNASVGQATGKGKKDN